ncbi:MAG: hypothetical protein HYX72_06985 [Acidobacteria bacterium]|nr:hypothetical protein [Acidobacteriota bacterium]
MLEVLIIFAVCTLAGLACLGAVVAVALSPETLNVDKIFSIIASLVIGLIFFSVSGWMLFHTRLRKLWRSESATVAKPPEKKAAAPAEQVPQEAGKLS